MFLTKLDAERAGSHSLTPTIYMVVLGGGGDGKYNVLLIAEGPGEEFGGGDGNGEGEWYPDGGARVTCGGVRGETVSASGSVCVRPVANANAITSSIVISGAGGVDNVFSSTSLGHCKANRHSCTCCHNYMCQTKCVLPC